MDWPSWDHEAVSKTGSERSYFFTESEEETEARQGTNRKAGWPSSSTGPGALAVAWSRKEWQWRVTCKHLEMETCKGVVSERTYPANKRQSANSRAGKPVHPISLRIPDFCREIKVSLPVFQY